jgi:hypothetical protein
MSWYMPPAIGRRTSLWRPVKGRPRFSKGNCRRKWLCVCGSLVVESRRLLRIVAFKLASMYAHQRTLRLADGPDEVHTDQIGRMEIAKHN